MKIFYCAGWAAAAVCVPMLCLSTMHAQEGTIDGPKGVAVNTRTGKIYAVNPEAGGVKVIDAAGKVKVVKTGVDAKSVGVDMTTDRVYVVNRGGNAGISVIDGKSDKVIQDIPIRGASVAAINPVTEKMYVSSSFGGGNANVIDLKTNVATQFHPGVEGNALVVDKKHDKIYFMGYEDHGVTVVDGATNQATVVPTPDIHLWEGALNEVTGKMYLPLSGDASVIVLNTKDNTKSVIDVGKVPVAVAVNEVTGRAYVLNYDSDSVSVLNAANEVIATVPVGTWPQALAVNAKTNRIYVANTHSNNVSVIDGLTSKVVATVPAGEAPWSIAVNPVTDKVYAANRMSDQVTVIDGKTNKATEK